ncbi:MAG: AEC family transporter [Opitutales bacterium]|nr:AEC family transporter [Opitutales bacterium]
MGTYLTTLGAVLPVFLIVALGFSLRKGGWFTAEADRTVLQLVLKVFYPCFIFRNILGNEALLGGTNFVVAPLMGVVAVGIGFLLAWPLALLFFPGQRTRQRTLIFCLGIFNFGYLAIPLMDRFFGEGNVGVLLVFNVGVELTMWTVGIFILSGTGMKGAWKKLLNPPVIAMALAMSINLLGWAEAVPEFVQTFTRMVGACAIPMGLLVSGCMVADFHRSMRVREGLRTLTAALLVRLGLAPLAFLGLALFLPLSLEIKQVLVIQAAMPAGIFPLVITRIYQGDTSIAVTVVIGTTFFSLFLIPLWISIGMGVL